MERSTPGHIARAFESAVRAEGEQMRESIAVFLHGEHDRTKSGVQARAMPEPDSKGG